MSIICDIDGTIADHAEERGHFDWHLVHTDSRIEPIVRLVNILRQHHAVLFVTGREDSCSMATNLWLSETFKWYLGQSRILLPTLFMRETGDQRSDTVVKREIYESHIAPHWNIELVLDDRDSVVAMWRELGLTCLQTRPGLF
jgi:hypothetical protein